MSDTKFGQRVKGVAVTHGGVEVAGAPDAALAVVALQVLRREPARGRQVGAQRAVVARHQHGARARRLAGAHLVLHAHALRAATHIALVRRPLRIFSRCCLNDKKLYSLYNI